VELIDQMANLLKQISINYRKNVRKRKIITITDMAFFKNLSRMLYLTFLWDKQHTLLQALQCVEEEVIYYSQSNFIHEVDVRYCFNHILRLCFIQTEVLRPFRHVDEYQARLFQPNTCRKSVWILQISLTLISKQFFYILLIQTFHIIMTKYGGPF